MILRFSPPMNTDTTADAIKVVDLTTGRHIGGRIDWQHGGTQLRYVFNSALSRGSLIEVSLGKASKDKDGNAVGISWTFRTPPAVVAATEQATHAGTAPRAAAPGPPAPADMQEFALWQINRRARAYGFAPLRLDGACRRWPTAHAWDMLQQRLLQPHRTATGRPPRSRLGRRHRVQLVRREHLLLQRTRPAGDAGVVPRHVHVGAVSGLVATTSATSSSAHYNRLGIGIAQSGGKVIVVWDFAG